MFFAGIYFILKVALLQIYPAYVCFKVIKDEQQQQYRPLLIYWVVAITYLAAEHVTDLFLFWLPFYNEAKLIVLLWLILPQTQGTAVVYTKCLDPFLTRHETRIDKTLIEIQNRIKESVLQYAKQFVLQVKRMISDVFFKSADTPSSPTPPPPPPSAEDSHAWTIDPYTIFAMITHIRTGQSQEQQHEGTSSADESSDGVKVERVESSNSLASTVLVSKDIDQSESWGKYVANWVWKSPAKKQE